jgi:hypothetical protein
MSSTFRFDLPQFADGLAMMKPKRDQACISRVEWPNCFIPKSPWFSQTLAGISLALEPR